MHIRMHWLGHTQSLKTTPYTCTYMYICTWKRKWWQPYFHVLLYLCKSALGWLFCLPGLLNQLFLLGCQIQAGPWQAHKVHKNIGRHKVRMLLLLNYWMWSAPTPTPTPVYSPTLLMILSGYGPQLFNVKHTHPPTHTFNDIVRLWSSTI